jgi:hypothetical protein
VVRAALISSAWLTRLPSPDREESLGFLEDWLEDRGQTAAILRGLQGLGLDRTGAGQALRLAWIVGRFTRAYRTGAAGHGPPGEVLDELERDERVLRFLESGPMSNVIDGLYLASLTGSEGETSKHLADFHGALGREHERRGKP